MSSIETTVQFEGETITITSEHLGNKNWSCGGDDVPNNYNNHTINIEYRGETIELEAWASINDGTFDENGLVSILASFCSDANSSEDTFSNFCSEFGYSEFDYDQECECYDDECDCECDYTNKEAKRVYDACCDTKEKFDNLGLDCSDLWNSIAENYSEAM